MTDDLTHPAARRVIEEGQDLLGCKVEFGSPETHHSQVAIYLHSMAVYAAVSELYPEIKPAVCAGLSLGEFTAVTVAGLLSFEQCLPLVAARGRLMSEACEQTKGAMAAVIGMDDEVVEQVCAPIEGLWVANYNAPGQVVISGTKEGVEAGIAALKEAGARRLVPLEVHGAFHSGLMESARVGLAKEVDQLEFGSLQETNLVMNVPGGYVRDGFADNMIAQVTHSVRWRQGVEAMVAAGVETFIEMGPGSTLAGMNRRIAKGATTISLDKMSDLEKLEELACV